MSMTVGFAALIIESSAKKLNFSLNLRFILTLKIKSCQEDLGPIRWFIADHSQVEGFFL
jgi:hypothetical protein